MRGRTYSTPFQIHTFWRNSRDFPKHDVTGEIHVFSKTRDFPKHDVTGEIHVFSKTRDFPKHDVIGENHAFSKTRDFPKHDVMRFFKIKHTFISFKNIYFLF